MSQAPSMPMFWDAYLADTTHLSTEEHGAYLLLLAAMWRRNGSVPDDDADNARIVGLTKSKWLKVKARLAGLLDFSDDEISQKKLRKIWKNTQEKIQKNRENGSLGGRPKRSENNGIAKANGFVSDNPKETIPEPEPEERDKSLSTRVTRFEEFWRVYPHRGGVKRNRKGAFQKYVAAVKRGIPEQKIIDGAKRSASDKQVIAGYARDPVTWINQEGWADEIAAPPDSSGLSKYEYIAKHGTSAGWRAA